MQKSIWQTITTKSELILSAKSFILFVLLGAITALPRFLQLGYSHFYGDETKTFYLDKTITAFDFFMSQRKGPVQFLVVWVMEKISPDYDPFIMRLPFAVAGFLAVFALYFFVKLLFNNYKIAFIAATLFSLNGFFIAFSRTVQYQSFLLLFGFTSLALLLWYFQKNSKWLLLLSGVSMGLAFLSHYDAINFIVIAVAIFTYKRKYKDLFIFTVPLLLLTLAFYIPYIAGGYFQLNTLNYLAKRVTGAGYKPNNSLYTFYLYNPNTIWIMLLLLSCFTFFKKLLYEDKLVIGWFLFSFSLYELIFSNPGTHILNYTIPLIIFIASSLYKLLNRERLIILCALVFSYLFGLSMYIYVPIFKSNYPWSNGKLNKTYQVFVYGFPYNRGWDQISRYVNKTGGVRGFYTNDNAVMSQYYLHGIAFTAPGSNFLPEYFIDVYDNQEAIVASEEFLANYKVVQQFNVDTKPSATLYKLTKPE